MDYLRVKNQKVSKTPLLDRIMMASERGKEASVLTKDQLIQSVVQSLDEVLNTRCYISPEDYDTLKPETLTYGIPVLYGLPDFSYYDPTNRQSWVRLKRYITNAIKLFEPRLHLMDVEVRQFDVNRQSLALNIKGKVESEGVFHLISFSLDIHQPTK